MTKTINDFLQKVAAVNKQAGDGTLAANAEGGPTTHPSKEVDNGNMPPKPGEQERANQKGLKDNVQVGGIDGDTPKVASTGDTTVNPVQGPHSEGGALNIGTTKKPTGKDPANETGSADSNTADPGSSHPARADNTSITQPKFASVDANTPVDDCVATLKQAGDQLVALLQLADERSKQASAVAAPAAAPAPDAGQIGHDLAGLFVPGAKEAADQQVVAFWQAEVKEAVELANMVADALDAQAQKRAEDDDDDDDGDKDKSDSGGGSGGSAPPSGGGGGGGGAPPSPAGGPGGIGGGGGGGWEQVIQLLESQGLTPDAVMQLLSGGGGGGAPPAGPDPMAAAGAPPAPPAPMPAGPDPTAAAGGPPLDPKMAAAKAPAAGTKSSGAAPAMANVIREILARR